MWPPGLARSVAAVVLVVGACSRSSTESQSPPEIVPVVTSRGAPPTARRSPVPSTVGDSLATDPEDLHGGIDEARAELQRFVEAVRLAWVGCSERPSACRPERDLGHVYGDPLLTSVSAEVRRWAERGWVVRPPLDPAHDRVELVSTSATAASIGLGSEAEVVYCDIDGRILVQAGTGADGGDAVIDETIVSAVRVGTVRRAADGAWRLIERRTEEIHGDGLGCRR